MTSVLFCLFWSFLIAAFSIPSVISMAHIKQLLDKPNSRNIHQSLTPRLGGVAIFAGFTSAISIFGIIAHGIQQVLASIIILFFIGLRDDIIPVTPSKKFLIQLLATGIVVFIGDIRITNFGGFLNIYELPEGISYAITFLTIIGITNAFNLIDGIDGLAGSLTIFSAGIIATHLYSLYTTPGFSYVLLACSLIGSVFGFLRYNFSKAIIFMGDTGSLICGFLVSILCIKFLQLGQSIPSAPAIAFSIVFIPIYDTIRVFASRILAGRSPFFPDTNHVHHIIKKTGLPSVGVVFILISINFIIYLIVFLNASSGTNTNFLYIGIFALMLTVSLEIVKKWAVKSNG